MSFANYKKNRVTDLAKLRDKVENTETKGKYAKDERFWRPQVDKAGNGSAVIRFLPEPANEDNKWAYYQEHRFDVDGKYFTNHCPTDLGRDCPVCTANTVLWKTEMDANKAIASKRSRKKVYVTNILVLKDKDAPENEGKVFLYKFGVKIFEKIKKQLFPADEEDTSVNVFDFYNGADFRLDIKKVKDFQNYDDSSFRASADLLKGDDEKLEKVYNAMHPLAPFSIETNYKSYDDLEKQFNEVVNGRPVSKKSVEELFSADSVPEKKATKQKSKDAKEESAPWDESKKSKEPSKAAKKEVVSEDVETEDDDANSYYDQLAEKD